MVIYDLTCEFQHAFEGWFKNSDDMLAQQQSGLLTCPYCESGNIARKVSAPKLARKSNSVSIKAESLKPGTISGSVSKNSISTDAIQKDPIQKDRIPESLVTGDTSSAKFAELQRMLGKVHDYVDANFQDVGNRFTEEAISMQRGEKEGASIRGTVTARQREELIDEGVQATQLPPKPIDKKKIN